MCDLAPDTEEQTTLLSTAHQNESRSDKNYSKIFAQLKSSIEDLDWKLKAAKLGALSSSDSDYKQVLIAKLKYIKRLLHLSKYYDEMGKYKVYEDWVQNLVLKIWELDEIDQKFQKFSESTSPREMRTAEPIGTIDYGEESEQAQLMFETNDN